LGGRHDRSLRELIKKIGNIKPGQRFITDDWSGYHRLIPEKQLFTGKDLTFLIESDNAKTRRNLARFRRKTQASSRSMAMTEHSIALAYSLYDTNIFNTMRQKFISMIG